MSTKRFAVALSFAGEQRDYVALVADELSKAFGQKRVLYDHYLEGIRKGVVHTESPPWLCGWHTYLPSFSEQIFKSAAQVGTPLPHRHPLFG